MKLKLISGLLMCGIWLHSAPQIQDFNFRLITPPGGISFQAVHTITQDLFGYVWIGTYNGVLKYDSKKITRYFYSPEHESGLPTDSIIDINVDRNNNVWIATTRGLCIFDRKLNRFNQVPYVYENGGIPRNQILSITSDGSGNLWIADQEFFGFLDTQKNQLVRAGKDLKLNPGFIYHDGLNRIWLGTTDGAVYQVLGNGSRIKKKIDSSGSAVTAIYAEQNQTWVGYRNKGLKLFDSDGGLIKHFDLRDDKVNDRGVFVRKIIKDTYGRIWIGSFQGLDVIIGSRVLRLNPDEFPGIPHPSIYEIFEDKEGGIWIGTWSGGIAYMHHSDNKFINFRHSNDLASISNNMVSSFIQPEPGELYVGTERGGLVRFDPKTGLFRQIDIFPEGKKISIKSMLTDKKGGVWIGTFENGLWYRNPGSKGFINFSEGPEDGRHISQNSVYTMCACDSGIWIGTNGGGVNFFSHNTNRISFFSERGLMKGKLYNGNIYSLFCDSGSNLWIGTRKGLLKIHIPSGKITVFGVDAIPSHQTVSNVFYTVNELNDKKLWIGTKGEAIYIFDPETDRLSYFDANGLLRGKDVYGIIEGTENDIWVTSNNGLILVKNGDPVTSRQFLSADGIQGDVFNPNAIFRDYENNLYFGGTNGFTKFSSSEIRLNRRLPNVLLNSVLINNNKIITPLQVSLTEFSEIELKPGENTLDFDFSADNFLLPGKNKFRYRLTGYGENWIETGSDAHAFFINLPSGRYVFEIMASNNDGVWNNIPSSIPVTIKKYWYRTNAAYILYLIIFSGILFFITRFIFERSKLKQTILIEKIQHENQEQIHEMKLKFFTNISHEFRTPLTLISWPVKNLLKSTNLSPDQKQQLETIQRNSRRLLNLINQIMDLRKVEKGKARLEVSRIELIGFMRERYMNFLEEAKLNHIDYEFINAESELYVEADREKLDKIIFNLLSNAFKFVSPNGKITIEVNDNPAPGTSYYVNQLSFGKLTDEEFFGISVTDTGTGIDSEDISNIFNRFESGKQPFETERGTGIGLSLIKEFVLLHNGIIIVQSTPGKGTCFIIRLPKKQKIHEIVYESIDSTRNLEMIKQQAGNEVSHAKISKDDVILLVEDNADLRKFIGRFLKEHFTVLFASDGIRCLDLLRDVKVDLIVSDVMMPNMDGFELCRRIKSEVSTSHIPVILLTALSSSENRIRGLEGGADAYIVKPFDEKILLSQIRNLLLQRKRLREGFSMRYLSNETFELGSLDNYFLIKVNTIIENNLENEQFTVEKLSEEAGISRSQLHRKLKLISNFSASEYINMVKIKAATSLLKSGRYSIDEVAFKTGFNSHSYFTRCFKKIHGVTPKEFINKLRSANGKIITES